MLLVALIVVVIVGTVVLAVWAEPQRWPPPPDHERDLDLRKHR